jgi:hypothetical protein
MKDSLTFFAKSVALELEPINCRKLGPSSCRSGKLMVQVTQRRRRDDDDDV